MTGKKISLNLRLNWLLVVCFVPLTVMVFYLLFTMNRFSQRYDHVVRNITKANEYNISFREELDYSMYIIVVNSERAEELLPSQPHERIDAARKAFQELYDRAQYATEKNELKRILTTLQTLEDHVTEMEQDAQIVGMYDRNLERLDMDIRILTELIQEQIQNYIYYETTNLENMRQGRGNKCDYSQPDCPGDASYYSRFIQSQDRNQNSRRYQPASESIQKSRSGRFLRQGGTGKQRRRASGTGLWL